jgi:hypothetical protein
MCEFPKTNTTECELPVVRVSTATTLAAIVTTNIELRLALCLVDQGLSCHDFLSITCGTECRDDEAGFGHARRTVQLS